MHVNIYVNIYQIAGEWCYAAFEGADFDTSDTLGVRTEAEARKVVSAMYPDANVYRVADRSYPALLERNAKMSATAEELARWVHAKEFWRGSFRAWLASQRGGHDPDGQW